MSIDSPAFTLLYLIACVLGAALGLWAGLGIRRFLHEIAYPWIERRVRRG